MPTGGLGLIHVNERGCPARQGIRASYAVYQLRIRGVLRMAAGNRTKTSKKAKRSTTSKVTGAAAKARPSSALATTYNGYGRSISAKEDKEPTHVGPGTACGEYTRRFWLPVAMSSQLTDLPLAPAERAGVIEQRVQALLDT